MCTFYLLKDRSALHSGARWATWAEASFRRWSRACSPGALHRPRPHASWSEKLVLVGSIMLNVFLFRLLPSTFFPEQDTGIVIGQIIADQAISFSVVGQARPVAGHRAGEILEVLSVFGFAIRLLRPCGKHRLGLHRPQAAHRAGVSARRIVRRLRPKLNAISRSGNIPPPEAQRDLHIGGRQTAAEYQYTLSGDDPGAIYSLVPKLIAELGKHPGQLTDVNTDMQQNGLQTFVTIDRVAAARHGLTPNQVDAVLYDAFGQRTVSTIYNPYNQYFVVMEVAPKYWQYSDQLG